MKGLRDEGPRTEINHAATFKGLVAWQRGYALARVGLVTTETLEPAFALVEQTGRVLPARIRALEQKGRGQ
jgi:hypothetical protein